MPLAIAICFEAKQRLLHSPASEGIGNMQFGARRHAQPEWLFTWRCAEVAGICECKPSVPTGSPHTAKQVLELSTVYRWCTCKENLPAVSADSVYGWAVS